MQLQTGATLQNGKYRIVRMLGQGGFGITYLAEHTNLKCNVCIKEFYPQALFHRNIDDEVVTAAPSAHYDLKIYRRKFLSEARKVFNMHHDNIVVVNDFFEENNTAYYVMEYIEGETLHDKINRQGKLSESDARRYIKQVANALSYIHKSGTLHLDIKPANIMVRSADDKVVVIDFGLARSYKTDTGNYTISDIAAFSPGYGPIEQSMAGNSSQLCPASDIYSLGATLYTLVTGKRPPMFNEDFPTSPTNMLAGTWNAISKSMEIQINSRPQSIEEFLSILDASPDTIYETSRRRKHERGSGVITDPVVKPITSVINQTVQEAIESHFNEVIRLGITINSNRSRKVVTNIYLDGKRCFKLISVKNRVGIYRVYSNNFALNKILSDKSRFGYQFLPGKSHTLGNNPEKITQLISEVVYPYAKVTYNTSAKLRNGLAFLSIFIAFAAGFFGTVGIKVGLLDICDYTLSTEMIIIWVALQILLIALFLTIVIKILRGKRVSKG